MALRESPYPSVERILTGHERRLDDRCWRPRGTPSLLLIHTRSGRAEVRIGGSHRQVISSGDTVLWQPGATHDFGTRGTTEPWELIWTHFHAREQWRDWLAWPMIAPGVGFISAPPDRLRARIEDALLEMDGYAKSALPGAPEFALNALERALLWLGSTDLGPARMDEHVREAVLFISRHLHERVSIGAVADAVYLSPSRLAHLFKQQTGMPVGRFIEQRRMERAQSMLESTSLPIGAISDATGFSSQFYFAARFRTLTGLSPTEWRSRVRTQG